ncbi:MAG: TIGR02302 family protein [Rubricella sp.]
MTEPELDAEARARLRRTLALTRAGMAVERAARAFWPLWAFGGIAYAAWAFGAWRLLEGVGPLVAVILHGTVALLLVAWGLRHFRSPSAAEALARVDARVPGRPLATLEDTLAVGTGNPGAEALWQAHRRRMAAEAAARADAVPPDLKMSNRDRYGLRLVAAIAVVMALLFARDVETGGAAVGLGGGVETQVVNTGPAYEGWVSPPSYTGRPTLQLIDLAERGGAVEIPAGSRITLRVYGEGDAALDQSLSGAETVLVEQAPGIRDAVFTAERSGTLALSDPAGVETEWSFTVLADTPPELAEGPELVRARSGATELLYGASDDYAVSSVTATIALDLARVDRRHGLAPEPAEQEPLTIELPLPLSGDRDDFEESLIEDFSEHPLASLPVTVTLEAMDAAAQEAVPLAFGAELPRRGFFDPLARAVVEQRRDLLWTTANAERVSRLLRASTYLADDLDVPPGAYLALRSAISRLDIAIEQGTVERDLDELAGLLWEAAVLIDGESLSDAEAALRRAQERLSNALEQGASDEEIAELTEELREAMRDYMDQLAREFAENPDREMAEAPEMDGPTMDAGDLEELLDRIQELSEAGETETAQALLEQLQRMLENMQITEGGPGRPGEGGPQEGLQDMLREQQDLADESFRELQREFRERMGQGRPGQDSQPGQGESGEGGDQPQTGGEGMAGLADRQEALRELLDDLRGGLPDAESEAGEEARRALEEAEDRMGGARDALRDGDGTRALDEQAGVMDALREGLRQLDSEARQARGQAEEGEATAQGDPEGRRDPLGRPAGANGELGGADTRVPDADAIGRSRELLDELRRRLGERQRSDEELDYLRRLLERF